MQRTRSPLILAPVVLASALLRLAPAVAEQLAADAEQRGSAVAAAYIVGSSAQAEHLRNFALRAALTPNAEALILGESGTGKSGLAAAINAIGVELSGQRPLQRVRLAGQPRELAASAIFGHVRGAFSGAYRDRQGAIRLAAGGDLIVEELGTLDHEAQLQLVSYIDAEPRTILPLGADHEVEAAARIIAVTNSDLKQDIAAGRFREDLYHRLNVLSVVVPPLRERKGDIPALVRHLLQGITKKLNGGRCVTVEQEAMAMLQSFAWPGNVRELANVLTRIIAWNPMLDRIAAQHLPDHIREASAGNGTVALAISGFGLPGAQPGSAGSTPGLLREDGFHAMSLFDPLQHTRDNPLRWQDAQVALKRAVLREALRRNGGDARRSAAALGMHEGKQLRGMMRTCGIEDELTFAEVDNEQQRRQQAGEPIAVLAEHKNVPEYMAAVHRATIQSAAARARAIGVSESSVPRFVATWLGSSGLEHIRNIVRGRETRRRGGDI